MRSPTQLFDNPSRQKTEKTKNLNGTQNRPTGVDAVLAQDHKEEKQRREALAQGQLMKETFQFVLAHPGCTQHEIEQALGHANGLNRMANASIVIRRGQGTGTHRYYAPSAVPPGKGRR